MGDSACLMQIQQPFSYVSGLPNHAKQGNPIHGLGQSISFGRFMTEPLAWEKWSSFSSHSQNRYVEEAERYARPGSVAQKKAFFEAHYKELAAKKAALEQAQAASYNHGDQVVALHDLQTKVSDSLAEVKDSKLNQENSVLRNKKKLVFTTLRTSLHSRAPKTSSSSPSKPIVSVWPKRKTDVTTPISNKSSMEYSDYKRKSTQDSTHKSMNFTPAREFNKFTSSVKRKIENSRFSTISSKASKDKDCCTPLKTPITGSGNKADKHSFATPQSENTRAKTSLDPASESKTIGSSFPKFLGGSRNKAQSPSTAFSLRTEERAARRKEKLEEKFNANVAEKVQLQTKIKEKAETELKRLRQNLCFKARPLPDFYKDRSTTNIEAKKVLLPRSPKLGKKLTPCTLQGRTTLPQKPTITVKNSGSKKVLAKNGEAPISILSARFRMRTHENTSPNIHHD